MKLEPAGYSASINFDQLNAIAAQRQGRTKPPRDGALPRSLLLALGAHALLVLMLVIGTAWTTSPPAAIEAELWAPLPREAAPKVVQPPPEPQPEVKPEPPKPAPPPKVEEDREADIALEKKKKEEQQRKVEAEKKQLEEEKKREELQAKKEAEQKLKQEKEKAAAELKKRDEEFERRRQQLIAQAGTGAPTATGTAAQAASPRGDASYAAKVVAAVRGNTVFDEASVASNDPVVFSVALLPDGTPGTVSLSKSSGDAAFDAAVERGIRKTNPFPRPDSGVYPRSLEIVYRPRK
ncbi:MAG: energy transducer TonB [Burkholderiaceae bacterium]